MLMESLSVALDASGDVALIAVTGELDHPDADELTEVCDLTLEARPADIRIDLTGVTFIGSYGLAVLLRAIDRCRQAGHEPALALGRPVRRLLDLTGVPLAERADGDVALAAATAPGPDRAGPRTAVDGSRR
jgi:anti-sigma B factor antagonist